MSILIESLSAGKKVLASLAKVSLLTLLALTICTCSGPKLMLGSQTLEKRIDYSTYFGRHANPISGHMECVILKTVGQVSHLCPQLNRSTLLQYQQIHGLEYCPNLVPMLRRCSQIRWYQFPSTIPSFSSRSRTVWTGQRPSSRIESLQVNSQEGRFLKPLRKTKQKRYQVLTPPSIGRTPATTPMMGRNLNSSSTMNQGNGKGRTTSSTTGGLRKQH